MANFSLSWESYKNNICSGLSALQQNGEFVDMTLAADGHHVKVHQLVMSLVSPYLKDIITSTQCQHPVIFLNKMSYTTLCAILEYVYTGEVMIEQESLPDLMQAANELCIKGLEDMKYEIRPDSVSQAMLANKNKGHALSKSNQEAKEDEDQSELVNSNLNDTQETDMEQDVDDWENSADQSFEITETEVQESDDNPKIKSVIPSKTGLDSQIQYSMSPQGSLQMILNRYVYYLRYTSRKGSAGHRLWKCSSYNRDLRCPATVVTQGGTVTKRISAHNHPFHDKAILRKVRQNAIFTAVDDNELQELVKNKGQLNPPAVVAEKNVEGDRE